MKNNMNPPIAKIIQFGAIILASAYLTFLVDIYTLNTVLKRVFVFGYFLVMCAIFGYLKKRFIKGRYSMSVAVLSAVIAVVILVVFQNGFLPTARSSTITLQAEETGEVWLTDVEIDGELVPVSGVQINDNYGWEYNTEYDDYVFYPKEVTTENHLEFTQIAKEINLYFATNSWSGTVRITDGAGNQSVVGLYSENAEQSQYKFSIYNVHVYCFIERAILNAGAFIVLMFFVSILISHLACVVQKIGHPGMMRLLGKCAPYIVAGVHWLMSFYTDNFIFVRSGLTARYVALKILLLFALILIWRLLFLTVRGVRNENQRVIKSLLFFLLFFAIFTIIMFCIWPGNWVWDDIWIFEEAVTSDFGNFYPWQHVITSFVYIISLMILPFPAGVVIVQYTFIAGIIGFILGSCYVGLKRKKYILLVCIPFVLFPTLAMIFYPMRLIPYAFLELMFFFLIMSRKEEKISVQLFAALVSLNAILAVWRSEGIIFLIIGPVVFWTFQKNKRMRIRYLAAVFLLFAIGALLQDHFIGSDKEYYGVTAYIEQMDDLVKYEYQVNPESAIMQELRENIDIDAILNSATGERAFWDGDGAYSKLKKTQQYDVVKRDFIKLVLKHPIVFIKERIYTFLATSALIPDPKPFVGNEPQIVAPEFITDYPLTHPINDNLRANTLSLLTGRRFDLTGVRADFRLWYNLLPPLLMIFALLIIEIKARHILHALCFLSLGIQAGVMFVLAPAPYFMYYFPIYLSGYFWGMYRFMENCDKKL